MIKKYILLFISMTFSLMSMQQQNTGFTYFNLLPKEILLYISSFIDVEDPASEFLLSNIEITDTDALNLSKAYFIENSNDFTRFIKNSCIDEKIKKEIISLETRINQIKKAIDSNEINNFNSLLEKELSTLLLTTKKIDINYAIALLIYIDKYIDYLKSKQTLRERIANKINFKATSFSVGLIIIFRRVIRVILTGQNLFSTINCKKIFTDNLEACINNLDFFHCTTNNAISCCYNRVYIPCQKVFKENILEKDFIDSSIIITILAAIIIGKIISKFIKPNFIINQTPKDIVNNHKIKIEKIENKQVTYN